MLLIKPLLYKYTKILTMLIICSSLLFSPVCGSIINENDDIDFSQIYVNSEIGNDNNTGTTEANPKKTIQNATDTVNDEGTLILTGPFSGKGNCNITIKKNLRLEGEGTTIDAQNHGGIFNITEAVTVYLNNINFKNGNANYGGAIFNTGYLEISKCTFTNNNAKEGGALYNSELGVINCEKSSFINNKATNGTVLKNNGTGVTLNFNRIIVTSTDIGKAVCNEIGSEYPTDATNNWWGTNNDPSKYVGGPNLDVSTWLVLSLNSDPNKIYPTETANLTANIYTDNNGVDHSNNLLDSFTGVNVNFNAINGILSPTSSVLENGTGVTIFTPNANFTQATITAQLDSQTINTTVTLSAPRIYVSPLGDDNNNGTSPDIPKKTIQSAITSIPPGGEIYIGPGLYDQPGDYNITINQSMKLIGEAANTAIDADGKGHIFLITNGASVTLENLSLQRGINDQTDNTGSDIIITGTGITKSTCNITNCEIIFSEGPSIFNSGKCIIDQSTIANNNAYLNTNLSGGAIYNTGSCTITNTNFESNSANINGGAIYNTGNTTISNSVFDDNRAPQGGAINNQGTCNMDNTNIKLSQAYYGAAIYNNGSFTCNLNNNQITENSADYSGGAIYNNITQNSTFNIDNSILTDNSAEIGSVIYNQGTETTRNTFYINNSNIYYNWVENGTIFNNNTILNIENSEFTENNGQNAAAIINNDECNIINTNFNGNSAQGINSTGGAILNIENGNLNIADCTFTENNGNNGGAIYNQAICNIVNSNFNGNWGRNGGAIDNINTCNINNTNLNQNSVLNGNGGAINNQATGKCTLTQTNFTENRVNIQEYQIIHLEEGESLDEQENITTLNECNGGAIANKGIVIIQNDILINNTAQNGGAVYNFEKGVLTIVDSNFNENNVTHCGGGIFNKGSLNLQGGLLQGNMAFMETGGGLENQGTATITDLTATENEGCYGGGINNYKNMTLQNSTITKNQACIKGGGISNNGNINITSTTVTNNKVDTYSAYLGYGGGLENKGNMTLESSTITQNQADVGGGIYNYNEITQGILYIFNSNISNNTAEKNGGGLQNDALTYATNNTINNNTPNNINGNPIQLINNINILKQITETLNLL